MTGHLNPLFSAKTRRVGQNGNTPLMFPSPPHTCQEQECTGRRWLKGAELGVGVGGRAINGPSFLLPLASPSILAVSCRVVDFASGNTQRGCFSEGLSLPYILHCLVHI